VVVHFEVLVVVALELLLEVLVLYALVQVVVVAAYVVVEGKSYFRRVNMY
jgi:hypothetical protein